MTSKLCMRVVLHPSVRWHLVAPNTHVQLRNKYTITVFTLYVKCIWMIALAMVKWTFQQKYFLVRITNNEAVSNSFTWHMPRHEKTCLQGFPTRQDSNWPAQLQRQARVLKLGFSKYRYYTIHAENNKGADQTARTASLLFAYGIRQVFSWCGSYYEYKLK